VRLQLHALAYNLGNFLRTLATPEPIKNWVTDKLEGQADQDRHGRYVVFQMAEVAIARQMFQEILRLIAELRPQPPPALAWNVRCHAFKSNRQKECVQMPGKMARSDPRPSVRIGVTLKNIQNSWSGRDATGKVVLTIWPDLFRDGVYVFPTPPPAANGRPRAGLSELVANLKHAMEHHGGRVGTVISRAENTRVLSRKIADARPGPEMRILRYDETGAFEGKWW
jgi:hypothetical protein